MSAGVIRYLRGAGLDVAGTLVLDAGAGGGALAEALASSGARTVALDVADHRGPRIGRTPFVIGRGQRLPFADDTFDLVVSSNVLEHVADPWPLVDELARVCRPGGNVWLSWTNWLSPIGGHEITPFHYLGPRLGVRVYSAIWRRPPRWNRPGETLFVTHIGGVLKRLRAGSMEVLDVAPRYWPSLRLLSRIPGIREVAMWNCVVLLRRPPALTDGRGVGAPASTGGTRPAS